MDDRKQCNELNTFAESAKEYKFKISIVMAIYNVEEFLDEAIQSVFNQTMNFERDVQLILVDDGTPDRSGEICDAYAEKYPNNITVIHKENGGSASARKAGVALAEGKYVNFLDPDDTISEDTLELVYNFFEEHYEETDLVAIPIFFCGTMSGAHPLNNKFNAGTRVIDLCEDWQTAQMSLASAFFKNEIVKEIDADPELVTSEDAKELIKIMTKKMTMGVVNEAKYNYRRYATSQVSLAKFNPKWYLTYLEHYTEWAVDYCKKEKGCVPKFVQYTLMYDLQWRFRPKKIEIEELSKESKEEYRNRLYNAVRGFDIDVIFAQKSLYSDHKVYLASTSYGEAPKIATVTGTNSAYFEYDNILFYLLNDLIIHLNKITINKGELIVEGTQTFPCIGIKDPQILVRVGGVFYNAELNQYDDEIMSADTLIGKRIGFIFRIPLADLPEKKTKIDFGMTVDSVTTLQRRVQYGKYMPITKEYKNSYYARDGFMVTGANDGFFIQPTTKKLVKIQEKHFIKNLKQTKNVAAKKAALIRKFYRVAKKILPKDMWIVTDKADRADDNGEAFFTYLCKNKDTVKCHPIFAISKDSSDYKRMKKIGKVIPYMSWRHKLYHLLAKHTVSAYSHDEISSPFLTRSLYYGDLLQNNKIIFLQHGIIKDDLSPGLNRRHKNFSLFVTSTERERNSILECNYGYSDDQVILTGLPRYDALYNDPQKKITIMPTWLRSLFGGYDANTSRWELLPGFEESEYFIFYNSLLNSEKLLSAAEEMGYKIQFMPHPVLFPYIHYFKPDPRATVLDPKTRYRDIFAQSSLITTDFSSVAFDFAYLRKPLIYTQFEENHYEEGYFDYERDGFGEVEKTLDSTVDRLIEYMKNDCQLKPQYRERIEKFYAFSDKNNCKRVYDEIIKLDENNEA